MTCSGHKFLSTKQRLLLGTVEAGKTSAKNHRHRPAAAGVTEKERDISCTHHLRLAHLERLVPSFPHFPSEQGPFWDQGPCIQSPGPPGIPAALTGCAFHVLAGQVESQPRPPAPASCAPVPPRQTPEVPQLLNWKQTHLAGASSLHRDGSLADPARRRPWPQLIRHFTGTRYCQPCLVCPAMYRTESVSVPKVGQGLQLQSSRRNLENRKRLQLSHSAGSQSKQTGSPGGRPLPRKSRSLRSRYPAGW
ncbi:uncharacterized protein LOC106029170 [Cavia porcellus]|uniref:uncharacterized protein LOC106029170 n=1 Tax=Cavia porcellus TaxID=10141 RepID=UPI002FDF9340